MLDVFVQSTPKSTSHSLTSTFLHLGALGLFFVAIIDSSPLPTFGGPDILTAILAAQQRNPWYEYAACATAGSVLGAWLTFRIAQESRRSISAQQVWKPEGGFPAPSVQEMGHRRSRRINGDSVSISYQLVFRLRGRFQISRRKVSRGGGHQSGRTLLARRHHRRSLWPPFCPCSTPSHPILGLVARLRRHHPHRHHGWNCGEQTARGCS